MTKEELNQVQENDVSKDVEPSEEIDFDSLWGSKESDSEESKPTNNEEDDIDDDEEEADDDIDNEEQDDEEEQNTDDTKSAESNDEFKLSIKFNKQDIDLNKEDAIKYAQMGMLSQKAIEQRDEYKTKVDKIEAIANKAGMSLDDFLTNVEAKQNEIDIENEIVNLKSDDKFKDLNDDVLKEIAELRVSGKKKDSTIAQREKVDAQTASQQFEISKQIDRFQVAHPEVDVNKLQDILTDKMYELIDKGSTILEAYDTVMNAELVKKLKAQEDEIKANKKNEENRKKSIGNTNSVASGDGHDPLLDILFGK